MTLFLSVHFSLSLYYSLWVEKEEVQADECIYYELAHSLAEKGTFADKKPCFYCPADKPTAFRPPIYPLFLSLILKITGEQNMIIGVRIIQCVLGLLFLLMMHKTCSLIFRDHCADICLVLSCFFQPFIYFYSKILSEFLAGFLTLFLFLLIRLLQDHKKKIISLTIGLVYATASLTRPNLIYLGFPIMAGIWLIPSESAVKKFFHLSLVLIVFLCGLGIWTARNYLALNHFCFLTSSAGYNLYSAAYGEKDYAKEIEPEIKKKPELMNDEMKADAYFYHKARNKILKEPHEFIKKIPEKLAIFLFSDFKQAQMTDAVPFIFLLLLYLGLIPRVRLFPLYTVILILVFWLIPFYHAYREIPSIFYFMFRKVTYCITNLYPFIVIGFIPVLSRIKERTAFLPVLLLIALVMLQNSLVLPRIRYRFIIEPYLLMIASCGMIFVTEKIKIILSCIFKKKCYKNKQIDIQSSSLLKKYESE
ncbi:MAG: glycosyltransferase family 39 protein [Candidatus Aureabacteria bacterium]|nr:glycosyltransferase family 39 protein [Candidatus Auribacterota bacterium]